MSQGIAFAADNRSMQDGHWQYESDKPKLTVDPTPKPPHLQLFELSGGTPLSMPDGFLKQETLVAFKHGFKFPPMFLCYFFTENAPALFAANIGQYTLNRGQMRYNALPWSEWLQASVDDTWFYIKHFAQNTGAPDTSYGSQYQFRVRLEIIARKAVFTGQ
jgi:hypothetical protein